MQGLTKHIDIFDIEGTSVLYNLLTGSIIEIDDDCDVLVTNKFKINDKICTYDDINYEKCE